MVRRAQLGERILLGTGGQGSVYRIPEFQIGQQGGFVYKEYKQEIRLSRGHAMVPGLQSLIRRPSSYSEREKKRFYRWATMPRELVLDAQERAAGYVMSEINEKYRGQDGTTITEIITLFQPRNRIENVLGFAPTEYQLASLTLNILMVFEFMHEHDVVVGDVSARNMVFTNPNLVPADSPLGPMQVKLLDADSFRVQGEAAVIQQLNTPNYETPELVIRKRRLHELKQAGGNENDILRLEAELLHLDKSSDVFKVGLILMRLWDRSELAYCVQDSQASWGRISRNFGADKSKVIRRMIDSPPNDRPSMKDVCNSFFDT